MKVQLNLILMNQQWRSFCLLLFLCLCSAIGYAQNNVKVSGTVLDEKGEPLIGVSIVAKSTTALGTVSDIYGNFSIAVPGNNTVLQFSYMGYVTQEISVGSKREINVIMIEDAKSLDEVVVVGFGTQKKVNLTGSVGIATAKDLQSRPVMNATQALQGLVPGLQISTNTGELDKNMSINIRGVGTIGDGSSGSPLILIDGMEGDLNTVNPQDIENISVLKDAAASSIYGSRAPFGVILVTTKRGKSGKASINYNNSFRFSSPMNMPRMMDSYTFANYFNQAHINSSWGQLFSDETMQKMLDFQSKGGTSKGGLDKGVDSQGNITGLWEPDVYLKGYANTDWFSEIYKNNNFSQEHNLSINGGGEKTTYYVSLGYLDQQGSLRHGDDGLKRYNVTGKINAELTSWLDFAYSIRFARTDNYRPSAFTSGLYSNIGRQTWPNLPVYDENGYYFNSPSPSMGLALGGVRNVQTDRIYHQGAFVFEPIRNWRTHAEFNYSTYTADARETGLPYYNRDIYGEIIDTKGTSSLYQDHNKENYLNLNIFSEYTKSFNDMHNFKVMAGFQAEEMKQSFFSAKAYGLLIEELPELNLTNSTDGAGASKVPEVVGYRNEWATAGFFGRLNYDYKGKYLAEVNMRYDGTSRFRKGSQWDLYPSISLGWNIARENFWLPLENVVNTLKFRASYGELGNQNTNVWYPTYREMAIGKANGDWLQGGLKPNTARIGSLVSTALTWETVRSWNVGLDWGLLNNRLTGSLDFYTRYTDNMVGPAPELPNTLGISAPKTNNCDLRTAGWELELAWNDRLNNGLGYGIKFMLSDAQSTIESYPSNTTGSIWNYNAGQKMGEIWGFETIGIARTKEEMDAHLERVGGQPFGSEWNAGDIMYADLDGKPGITKGAETLEDHGDLKVIGNDTPRYLFGIDLTADWKGFDIRAFFQGVMKHDVWNGSNMFWGVKANLWWSTGFKEHTDYFRAESIGLSDHNIPANLDAYYPRPLFRTDMNQQTQTRYLQDASYIRLKNLQIGYTLPSSLTRKIAISNCRLFISGENVWTGTSLSKLFDPETITGGGNSGHWATSDGGNAYPLSRTWSFGINVTL